MFERGEISTQYSYLIDDNVLEDWTLYWFAIDCIGTIYHIVVVGVVVLIVLMELSVKIGAIVGFSKICVTTYGWRVNDDRARGKREKEQV